MKASCLPLLSLLLVDCILCSTWPVQTYKSFDHAATTINYTKQGEPTSPGYLFISPGNGHHFALAAPTIITDEGQLMWRYPGDLNEDPTTDDIEGSAAPGRNFQPQSVHGTTYLTYWTGDALPKGYGAGYGGVTFLDSSYNQVYKVCVSDFNLVRVPGGKTTQTCTLDFHESRVTSRGTLLATLRNVIQADLSPYGGPVNGFVLDSMFLEIDIPTNKVLFSWSPSAHLDQLDTYAIAARVKSPKGAISPSQAWDFFHMNSVAEVPAPQEGYIVSSRVMSSAIKVSPTGDIQWYIKGNTDGGPIAPYGGNFTLDENASFQYQHDISVVDVSATVLTITLFNNNNRKGSGKLLESSGLQLQITLLPNIGPPNLDTGPLPLGIATLSRRLTAPNHPTSTHIGSFRALDASSGHALLNFGDPPQLNEYDAQGNAIYQALVSAPDTGYTYRAIKASWTGLPGGKPSVVAMGRKGAGTAMVYMSWNGATEVKRWVIFAGPSADAGSMTRLRSVVKSGFETTAVVQRGTERAFVMVRAVDAGARLLGTSEIVATRM